MLEKEKSPNRHTSRITSIHMCICISVYLYVYIIDSKGTSRSGQNHYKESSRPKFRGE